MFDQQLAWWIGGPIFGLSVLAVRALFGARLGVTGGFSELIEKIGARSLAFDWRGWFAIGLLAGGLIYVLAGGGHTTIENGYSPLVEATGGGYGWLTRELPDVVAVLALMAGGVAIGYGAKVAGGCTSGNGLSGCASLSPGSMAATATFFGTAIVVNVAITVLT